MATPPTCPYCQSRAVLCSLSAIYGPKFEGRGNAWVCANYPECDSYVSTKPGLLPDPAGTMANPELRKLRKQLRAFVSDQYRPRKRKDGAFAAVSAKAIGWMDEHACRQAILRLEAEIPFELKGERR